MGDRRYRDCMAEIVAVLKKYDMAGAVTLVDRDRSMFRYQFPTWSCVSHSKDGLRFRAKEGDYETKEAHHQAVELSTHIILQMRDIGMKTAYEMNFVAEALGRQFRIEHVPFTDFDPET